MRVATYYSNSDVRLEDLPRPAAGPGEIVMRVEASGICGSDVMAWYREPRAPAVLGHEVAGVVVETGDDVTAFAAGDRIVTTHHVPCMTCRLCRADRHTACPTLHETSFDPGGFAEYVRLPAINVRLGTFRLQDGVGFDEATFVEPLACVLRGQRLAGLAPGDSVAVLGAGMSGALHLLAARAAGAGTCVATDVHRFRLDAARTFGADHALDASAPDAVAAVRRAAGGAGADRVIVCTGARPAFEQALAMVADGGSILFFAPLPPGETLELPVNDLWKRGVALVHSYAGPPPDMRRALELIASRDVDVRPLVTHRLPLAGTGAGFKLVESAGESLKVIIEPQR